MIQTVFPGVTGAGNKPVAVTAAFEGFELLDQLAAGLGHQFGDLVPGVGALDRQHRQLRALVQLHVVAGEPSLHPGHVLITGGGIDHQAITGLDAIDDHVVDHPAVLVEHRAVQGATRSVEALDIIGQQMAQPSLGLAAGDIDHGHVRDIEHTAVTSYLMVLLDLRTVMQWHIPTAKIDHLRAKGEVQVIERRTLSHGFLLPGVAKARTGRKPA